MDEREPDSAGRPLTRREIRERDAAASAAFGATDEAAGTGGVPVRAVIDGVPVQAVTDTLPATGAENEEPGVEEGWDAQVRWSLHHELPPVLHEEPDEDDVLWEAPSTAPQLAEPEPEPEQEPEAEASTVTMAQVSPVPGAVPRRRSVWLIDEPDTEPEPQSSDEPSAEPDPAPVAEVWSAPVVEEPGDDGEPGPDPVAWPDVAPVPVEETTGTATEQPAPSPVDEPLPTLSDLLAARPSPAAGPAQLGWQGFVRRMTGGLLRLRPGPSEQAHREAVEAVQRPLDGPRTIVVINPKGGAHKTTGTLLLAAAFGQHRGGYTLAWDNNETRGTLGWRSLPGSHQRTAVDLLQNLDRFAEGGAARVGDLDSYVRSQGSAQFDVLASDEDAASAASVDAFAFRALHRTLSRFYRVMVVDTGNNMRASNWQAAIDAADQVVIVSTVREDTAQSAAWAIDALRATGHADVVRNAVTVLSDPAPQRDAVLAARLHEHFGQLTRAVVDVPYDASLVGGSPLVVEHLDRRTLEAWLRVAAVVAGGL